MPPEYAQAQFNIFTSKSVSEQKSFETNIAAGDQAIMATIWQSVLQTSKWNETPPIPIWRLGSSRATHE